MNSEQFSQALEGISEHLVDKAATVYDRTAKKRRIVRRLLHGACAAVLALALLIGVVLWPAEDIQVVSAAGILKAYAYDLENAAGADVSKLEGIEMQEGVELPSNIGWGAPMNLYPGLPMTLSVPESYFGDAKIILRISVDGGEYFRKFTQQTGYHWWGDAYLGQSFEVENHQMIFWHFIETDSASVGGAWDSKNPIEGQIPKLTYFEGEKAFTEITILADGHIVGAALIEIYADVSRPLWYLAKLVGSVTFPQINGEYQHVTEEYVKEQMAIWKS